MHVNVNQDSFPYPTMFLVASRAAGKTAPPVQPIGVLIAKQTVRSDGTIVREQQAEILTTDVEYASASPSPEGPWLSLHFENDLAPTKPRLDVVAVRDSGEAGRFGTVRIKRKGQTDFGDPLPLDYGWRSRMEGPRQQQAGDVVSFVPDPDRPFALPNAFDNGYFNGCHLPGLDHLRAGDVVEYAHEHRQDDGSIVSRAASIWIPAGPTLEIRIGDDTILPQEAIDLSADTLVYDVRPDDPQASRFLVTWRAVFAWDDRLANAPDATLEVH